MITKIDRRHLIGLSVIICQLLFNPARALAGETANYNVVPLPQSIVEQKGDPFILEEGVQILAPAELQNEAEFLRQ